MTRFRVKDVLVIVWKNQDESHWFFSVGVGDFAEPSKTPVYLVWHDYSIASFALQYSRAPQLVYRFFIHDCISNVTFNLSPSPSLTCTNPISTSTHLYHSHLPSYLHHPQTTNQRPQLAKHPHSCFLNCISQSIIYFLFGIFTYDYGIHVTLTNCAMNNFPLMIMFKQSSTMKDTPCLAYLTHATPLLNLLDLHSLAYVRVLSPLVAALMDIHLAKSYETKLQFGKDMPFIIENLLNMIISERFVSL